MKKFLTLILALALILSLSVPAFAEGDDERKVEVEFNYNIPEPKYSVTIPAGIALKLNEDVELPITVAGTESLSGRKVVITYVEALIGKPDNYDSITFIVTNPDAGEGYYKNIMYTLGSDYWYQWGLQRGITGIVSNYRLFKFEQDGTKIINATIPTSIDSPNWTSFDVNKIWSKSAYVGYMVFGVKLEW